MNNYSIIVLNDEHRNPVVEIDRFKVEDVDVMRVINYIEEYTTSNVDFNVSDMINDIETDLQIDIFPMEEEYEVWI